MQLTNIRTLTDSHGRTYIAWNSIRLLYVLFKENGYIFSQCITSISYTQTHTNPKQYIHADTQSDALSAASLSKSRWRQIFIINRINVQII